MWVGASRVLLDQTSLLMQNGESISPTWLGNGKKKNVFLYAAIIFLSLYNAKQGKAGIEWDSHVPTSNRSQSRSAPENTRMIGSVDTKVRNVSSGPLRGQLLMGTLPVAPPLLIRCDGSGRPKNCKGPVLFRAHLHRGLIP